MQLLLDGTCSNDRGCNMSGIHDWRFPSAKNKVNPLIPIFENKKAYSAVWARRLFVQNAYQDFQSVSILKNLKQCSVHGQMLNGLQHLNKTLWLEKFTSSQQPYPLKSEGGMNIENQRKTHFGQLSSYPKRSEHEYLIARLVRKPAKSE